MHGALGRDNTRAHPAELRNLWIHPVNQRVAAKRQPINRPFRV